MWSLGMVPYHWLQAREMMELLKSGHRLEKPKNADKRMYVVTELLAWYFNLQLQINVRLLADAAKRSA